MNVCFTCCDNLTISFWEAACAPTALDFDAIAPTLRSGDLFIATANSAGRTPGQYMISASPWDHVGMIWVENGEVYVIDSGSARYYANLCVRPLHFGAGSAPAGSPWTVAGDGLQMYPLRAFIEEVGRRPLEVKPGTTPWYYSRMGIRRLAVPLTDAELGRLRASIESLAELPYQKEEHGANEATNAAIDVCDCCGLTSNGAESRDSLFCSEFVAAAYMDAGLLPSPPKAQPSCEYVPADFSPYHGSNLSAPCGCCWLSHALGRCGVGDLRRDRGSDAGPGRLYRDELVLRTRAPPLPPPEPGAMVMKRG